MASRKERRFSARRAANQEKILRKESPKISFQYEPGALQFFGPIIETDIGITQIEKHLMETAGIPVPPPIRCRFLIDTGAECTIIKHEIAERAQLKLVGDTIPIQGIGVDSSGREYLGRVTFHTPSQIVKGGVHHTSVEAQILSGNLDFEELDGLIGRDILSHFQLVYDGPTGLVTLKFIKTN